ncbi:MAG TPA: prenyltransferase [Gemmatimonadaceae bacterium]
MAAPLAAAPRPAAAQLRGAVLQALRPFSFTIAAISCFLGIALAWRDGGADPFNAALTLVAGVLMQAGVNLVNDFFEFKHGQLDNKFAGLAIFGDARSRTEWVIYGTGMACFAVAVALGLVLVARTGISLLWIGIVGLLSAYFYTGEPLNYKRRGLAVALVFIFMGALMVEGAYVATAGRPSLRAAIVSIPVSLLVSLLLLSNELRDFEDDTRHGIRTLTVRIGYARGARLYRAMLAGAYVAALAVAWWLRAPWLALVALSAPVARQALRFLPAPRESRRPLTPRTAKLHLVFGMLFVVGLLLTSS